MPGWLPSPCRCSTGSPPKCGWYAFALPKMKPPWMKRRNDYAGSENFTGPDHVGLATAGTEPGTHDSVAGPPGRADRSDRTAGDVYHRLYHGTGNRCGTHVRPNPGLAAGTGFHSGCGLVRQCG